MTIDELDNYTYKESERLFKYICKQPDMLRQIIDYMEKDSDYLGSISFDAIKFYFYTRPIPYLLDLVSKATNIPILIQPGNIKLLTLDDKVGIKFKYRKLYDDR